MPRTHIVRQTDVIQSARVVQVQGMFDLTPDKTSKVTWDVDFELPESWNIGVIVGPSGSGKTTVAKEIFGEFVVDGWSWDENKSVVDSFPSGLSINEISSLLSSVGFSSPPSWLRPYHVLSNGEKFRVDMARTLAEDSELSVIDEFTSVVDRTVAKTGSAAIQKAVRRRNKQLIVVSCHYDILDWLEPDWVFQPATGEYYTGRYLHQRPELKLTIKPVHRSAWELFRKHHYLDTSLNKAAQCFCGFIEDSPVTFTAVLHFPHQTTRLFKREHRTVCLPDFQGVGLGNSMSDFVASICKGVGFRYISQTSHPAMIFSRNKSRNWKMTSKPKRRPKMGKTSTKKHWRPAKKRNIASFEYVGEPLEKELAIKLWEAK